MVQTLCKLNLGLELGLLADNPFELVFKLLFVQLEFLDLTLMINVASLDLDLKLLYLRVFRLKPLFEITALIKRVLSCLFKLTLVHLLEFLQGRLISRLRLQLRGKFRRLNSVGLDSLNHLSVDHLLLGFARLQFKHLSF